MSQVTIFANGEIFSREITLLANEIVIAADGGARHCLKLDIIPQIVIGDFDSLSETETKSLKDNNVEFIRYPADKDETDLELALNKAMDLGATRVKIFGLLGGRWDMSIANLLLLAAPRYAGIRFHIWAGRTEAFILRGGETQELQGQSGDTVSVIPLSASIHGLTYEGLQWHLDNATLSFGTPRGVSNVLSHNIASIQLDDGVLIIILIHN